MADIHEVDLKVETTTNSNFLGNLHPDSTKIIFAESLLFATSLPDDDFNADTGKAEFINFNTVAAKMFLTPPKSGDWHNASAIRPRPLEEINKEMDSYMLSALKAFTSGFHSTDVIDVPAVASIVEKNVSMQLERDGLALVANKEYTVLHLTSTVVASILLLVLAWLNLHQNNAPFDLDHVRST